MEHSRSQYEHKWQKNCRVAFKYNNLYGENTILSALCNWLTSLILCVSSFLYAWLWPLYGFYLNRFSALLFWSDGCNCYQTGVFNSFHIRSLKKQSLLLLTNSHIPNCGLQKNADGHMVKLGWPASGDALPEMNWIFLWIKMFYLVTTWAPTIYMGKPVG